MGWHSRNRYFVASPTYYGVFCFLTCDVFTKLDALTPAPEQGYLFVVNDDLYWVTYHKYCFVNTEVNDDHSRAMIGYCFCYKDPDWSNSYFISDLL